MPIEFAERIRRIPVYPAADGYALAGDVALLASNESPYPPLPAVVEAVARALTRRQPLPRPDATRRCAGAVATATASPPSRIAIGNGSCDILLAAGEALLEPGAEVVYAWPSFSVYPHLAAASGARAIEVPVDDEPPPRPRRDARGDHRRHAAGDRLQPEQPDVDGAAARGDRRVRRAVPRHVARDPRRGLLRVQPAPGPRRVDRPARHGTRTSSCCARSPRSTGCAACAWATRCAARRTSAPRSTRCASRSSATSPRRPPRSRRSGTRTRSPAASSATSPSGWSWRTACAASGSPRRSRRPTSSGSTCRTRAPSEREVVAALCRARRARPRRHARSDARARCA